MSAHSRGPEGTFEAIIPLLPYLRNEVGVTAIELTPVAQFPGARNWGYDTVFPFAPQNSYGGPGNHFTFPNYGRGSMSMACRDAYRGGSGRSVTTNRAADPETLCTAWESDSRRNPSHVANSGSLWRLLKCVSWSANNRGRPGSSRWALCRLLGSSLGSGTIVRSCHPIAVRGWADLRP